MKRYQVTVQGKSYTVELVSRHGNNVEFLHEGTPYRVSVDPLYDTPPAVESPAFSAAPSRSTSPSYDPNVVSAPIPGVVVQILVKPGDPVRAGEPVCVIEAMKMENNIVSPRDGTVEAILCARGDEVASGAPLIRLK